MGLWQALARYRQKNRRKLLIKEFKKENNANIYNNITLVGDFHG